MPESSKAVTGKERKLPAGIGPDPQEEKSKSAEILANPVLVKVKLNLSLNRFKIYSLIQVFQNKVIYLKTFFSLM